MDMDIMEFKNPYAERGYLMFLCITRPNTFLENTILAWIGVDVEADDFHSE